MIMRNLLVWLVVASLASAAFAQNRSNDRPARGGWRVPGSASSSNASSNRAELTAGALESGTPVAQREAPLRPVDQAERRSIARVTKGNGTLPNDHGQIWREYDLSPYTMRVTSTNQPEQAVVDWILRETGYEAWHSEPLGVLSANSRTLRVYHTPQIQEVVGDIVDRFVSTEAETQAFGLRIVTIENPNWRARALRLMKPVPVQSQGVQGWLVAKEDAALLMSDLAKRSDFREHSSPHLLVHNGQAIVVSTIHPRPYVRGVTLREGSWPGYEPEMGQIEEGYSLEFSPLLALNGGTVDAVVKVRLCQVEKMLPVTLDVPTPVAPRQRTRVEVPQVTMSNLHERFRWPTSQVLLLSMGVVATPAPTKINPLTSALPLPSSPGRADALLFVECKGRVAPAAAPAAATAQQPSGNYPRRY